MTPAVSWELTLPWQLSLLAALWFLTAAAAIVLVRDPGPLQPLALQATGRPGAAERAVRWLGRPLTPMATTSWARPYARVVERWLAYSGRDGTVTLAGFAERHLGLVVLASFSLGWLTTIGQGRLGLVLLVVAAVLPMVQLLQEVRRRQTAIERDMPPFLELMSILLASGLTFRQALMRVSGRLSGPLAEETRLLLNQLEFGYTPRDAFDDLVRRSSAPTVKRVVATVRQNYELGVPIAQALSLIAEEVRAEAVVTLKLRAQNAGTLAGLVLVFVALPAVMALLLTVLIASALGDISLLLEASS